MLVLVIIEYDRRTSGISNTPLDMEYGNNRTTEQQKRGIYSHISKHTTYNITPIHTYKSNSHTAAAQLPAR